MKADTQKGVMACPDAVQACIDHFFSNYDIDEVNDQFWLMLYQCLHNDEVEREHAQEHVSMIMAIRELLKDLHRYSQQK